MLGPLSIAPGSARQPWGAQNCGWAGLGWTGCLHLSFSLGLWPLEPFSGSCSGVEVALGFPVGFAADHAVTATRNTLSVSLLPVGHRVCPVLAGFCPAECAGSGVFCEPLTGSETHPGLLYVAIYIYRVACSDSSVVAPSWKWEGWLFLSPVSDIRMVPAGRVCLLVSTWEGVDRVFPRFYFSE